MNPNAHLVVDEMYPCTGTGCSRWFQTQKQTLDHFELFHWVPEQATQHALNSHNYAAQVLQKILGGYSHE